MISFNYYTTLFLGNHFYSLTTIINVPFLKKGIRHQRTSLTMLKRSPGLPQNPHHGVICHFWLPLIKMNPKLYINVHSFGTCPQCPLCTKEWANIGKKNQNSVMVREVSKYCNNIEKECDLYHLYPTAHEYIITSSSCAPSIFQNSPSDSK